MRVIAGRARRAALVAPAGAKTRPTSDRAKEGLFNLLGPAVGGAAFLDLYCGSGQIGIEALSRGAKEAVFVDDCPDAARAVLRNLEKTRFGFDFNSAGSANSGRQDGPARAEVLLRSVSDAVDCLAAQGRRFDVVFLDPPFGSGFSRIIETIRQVESRGLLGGGARIVAEAGARAPKTADRKARAAEPEPESKLVDNLPRSLYLYDKRAYGAARFFLIAAV